MISANFTLNDTTPVKILDSQNFEQHIYVHNEVAGAIYVGGSDVTATSGFHLGNHESLEIRVPQDNELYAITGSGAGTVIVLRPN